MIKEKPTHPDQKYIEALLHNDESQIREIYKKWGPEARNFVLKNKGTPEDAKDIFQETIAALLIRIRKKKFTLTVPLGGYLYFIYRSKWFNKLAKNKKNPVTINDLEGYKNDNYPETDLSEINLLELRTNILKTCFEQLSERCKNILNGQYEEGLKGAEIMEKYKLPSIGAVRKGMYDCRESLKKLMMKHPNFKELNLS